MADFSRSDVGRDPAKQFKGRTRRGGDALKADMFGRAAYIGTLEAAVDNAIRARDAAKTPEDAARARSLIDGLFREMIGMRDMLNQDIRMQHSPHSSIPSGQEINLRRVFDMDRSPLPMGELLKRLKYLDEPQQSPQVPGGPGSNIQELFQDLFKEGGNMPMLQHKQKRIINDR